MVGDAGKKKEYSQISGSREMGACVTSKKHKKNLANSLKKGEKLVVRTDMNPGFLTHARQIAMTREAKFY